MFTYIQASMTLTYEYVQFSVILTGVNIMGKYP